jgi:quercetin dioxygenase-like cupin family protein
VPHACTAPRIPDFELLSNPGVASLQIVWPANAPDARVTITRVTMEPGAVSRRHSHPRSEQTWIVESGTATMLLADDQTQVIGAGEVLRTPAGEIHGVVNTGRGPFVYLAVTAPPQDFTVAYGPRG